MKFILYALLIWFLYNLIFKFIIPIYRTTSQVRKKFREMNEQMQQQNQDFQQQSNPKAQANQAGRTNTSETVRKGDYLDFEEIK